MNFLDKKKSLFGKVANIESVNEIKPDYVGFVFANKSKRYISPDKAYELKQEMETVVKNLIKNTIRQYENYSHQFSETDRETLMKRLNENETSLIENLNSQVYF